jgi:hypothetical protein
MIEELKNKIFSGEMITKDEAMSLIDAPLDFAKRLMKFVKSFVTMYLTYVQ